MRNLRGYLLEVYFLLKVITFKKALNVLLSYFSLLLSFLFRKQFFLGKPWALTIEPSSVCTLFCPECLVGMGKVNRKEKFMSQGTFRTILVQLPPTVFYINLYWQGEPLLDKQIIEKIIDAKRKRFFVALATNAQQLSSEVAEKLVLASLDKIIISLDGLDETSYLAYRKGGDFSKVIQALSFLHQAKRKFRSSRPLVEVQFLMFPYLRKKEIQREVTSLPFDKIVFKKPQYYHKVSFKKKRVVCPKLQEYLVVATTGEIVPCCQDKLLQFSLGNIHNTTILQAWHGERLRAFRFSVQQGEVPLCQTCNFRK